MNENTNMNQEEYLDSLLNGANNIPQDSAINILGGTVPSATNAPTVETTDANTQSVDASTITTATENFNPEEVVIKDIDNTDVADLLSSIDDYSSYITDNVSKIEEFNQNLEQIIFPETHLENYLSLEEYYKVEKNLPFGDKKFEDLTDEERNNVAFLYKKDMQFDRNKIINIIRDKYQNHRNEFVNNIAAKTKQTSRLVESFVHEMNSKKEALELKVKWALEDMESLERERTTVGTSFERAQEILEEQRKLQKEIDNNKALISNYNGLISLGNSYGALASTINAKIADNKLDLTNDLKDLNSIYDTIKKARKNTDVVETKAAVEEDVKEETKEATIEEIKEEVVEEKKEETPENLQTVENPPAVVEQPVKEEVEQAKKDEEVKPIEQEPEIVNDPEKIDGPTVMENPSQSVNNDEPNLTNKMPRSNYNSKKTNSNIARAVINKRKSGYLVSSVLPIVALSGIALLSSPLSGFTLPIAFAAGAGLGAGNYIQRRVFEGLKDAALKRKLDKFAKNYDVEVVFDYDKQKAYFAKLDSEGKYQIIRKYEELENRLIDKLVSEGNSKEEAFNKAYELNKDYLAKFNKLSGGIDLRKTPLDQAVTPVFDKIGGITSKKSLSTDERDYKRKREVYDNEVKRLYELLDKKHELNLTFAQIEKIESDLASAKKEAYKIAPAISKVGIKMNDIKDTIVNSKLVKNAADFLKPDEDLFDEYEKEYEEENLKNQKSEVEEEPTIVDGRIVNEEAIKESTFENTLNEDDLMKESEELQNDDVIVENPNITKSSENDEQLDNLEKKLNEFADDVRNDAINDIQTKENLSEEDRQTLKSIMNVNIQNALESGDTAYYDKLVQEYYEQFPEEKPVQENEYGMSK